MARAENVGTSNASSRTRRQRRTNATRQPAPSLLSRLTGAVTTTAASLNREVRRRTSDVMTRMGVTSTPSRTRRPASPPSPPRRRTNTSSSAPSRAATPTLSQRIEQGGQWLGDKLRGGTSQIARNPFALTPVGGILARALPPLPALPRDSVAGRIQGATESAIKGVGEFAASTVEDVASMVANPVETAKGLGRIAIAAEAAMPTGMARTAIEARLRGRPFGELHHERTAPITQVAEGIVDDFQETRDEIGLPGAIVKAGLDIFGLPKTVALKGGRLGRLSRALPDPDPVRRARRETASSGPDATLRNEELRESAARGVESSRETVSSRPTVRERGTTPAYDPARLRNRLDEATKEADSLYGDKIKEAVAQRESTVARLSDQLKNTTDPEVANSLNNQLRKARELSEPETMRAWSVSRAFAQEADTLIEQAVKDGRVAQDSVNIFVKKNVAWGLFRDAERQGIINSRDVPGIKKELSPFHVKRTEGADEVRRLDKELAEERGSTPVFDGLENFDIYTGSQLVPDSATRVARDGTDEVFLANRILETQPTTLRTPGGEVRLYGGTARDIEDAGEAIGRMMEATPNMTPDVRELHFSRLIEESGHRYSQADPALGSKAETVRATQGFVMTTGEDGVMMVRSSRVGNSDASFAAREQVEGTRSLLRTFARQDKKLDPAIAQRVATKHAPSRIPESKRPRNRKAHTVAHETAHSFDKRYGWKSETGEWGPFGEGTSYTKEAGSSTDFVSNYARSHSDPKTLAHEDFAETVAFISQFRYLGEKPPLGRLSDALVAKLEGAGKVMGTDPEWIRDIIRHYNE